MVSILVFRLMDEQGQGLFLGEFVYVVRSPFGEKKIGYIDRSYNGHISARRLLAGTKLRIPQI